MMYVTYILRELFLFLVTLIGLFVYPLVYLFRKSIWNNQELWKWLILYWFADTKEPTFVESFYGVYELLDGDMERFKRMNAVEKFILSYRWAAIRNPHWNFTVVFKPNYGEYEDVKVYEHIGDASPLTFRNKKIFGKQYVTYSIGGTRYFRYSFTRELKKRAIMRLFGYEYINFMAGASNTRYLLKLRFFK